MFRKSFWYCLALFSLIPIDVFCGPDLCGNPKIDSIVWIDRNKMWFFTSGGYYYYVKEGVMPPLKSDEKPLPSGFKVGEAAVLRETELVCNKGKTEAMKKDEVLIYLVEKMGDRNRIHIYDTRINDENKRWITGSDPLDFNNDHSVGQAKIDKTKPIDAMVSRGSQLYLIQGFNYAGIDLSKLCINTDDYANAFDFHNVTDFQTVYSVDAMTIKENGKAYMFIKDEFWIIKLDDPKPGLLTGTKDNNAQQIATDFFKCRSGEQSEINDTISSNGPEPPTDSPPIPEPSKSAGVESKGSSSGEEKDSSSGEEKGSGIWIIGVIVAIVVVVIVIALIAVVAMRKKKSGADSEADGMAAGGAEVSAGAARKSSIDDKVGRSKVGSKVDSKVGPQMSPSKTSSKMTAPSSLGGTSPSKMSVRSMMSTIPKGMKSKSSPKRAVDKQSSVVKSSMSKK
jgi:hypothetical protein